MTTTISTQSFRPRPPEAGPVERPIPVDADEQREIEQFLYFEAQLLDEARYSDWLDLLAEEVSYRMPSRGNRMHRDLAGEASGPGDLGHYDEDLATLRLRAARVQQTVAWSDNPPPRVVRAVTNVQATRRPELGDGVFAVRSVVDAHRNRLADDTDRFTGFRADVLRRGPDGLLLAERTVYLADSVLLAKNASLFL
ncbi:3-phenylpropionate/cinnamic acid dioxygenase subunit beta [Nocardiopsis lucentensis]|uniref:3-phenylpropionate/cinnamic acid dioxygenase subunit beta n=1 Tax=Nocardiopsis lucentensis TaxID=53441 RepID=UPI000349C2C0|nr:3-phenylpropionate/cinnamic acid dioxygenase subunit beta [Nocardiopsis lucentensis]